MKTFKQIGCLALPVVLLLSACGSAPKRQTEAPKVTTPEQSVEPSDISAQSYLDKAAQASIEAQPQLYLRAADRLLFEEQPAKALALLMQQTETQLEPELKKQKDLFKAEALLALSEPKLSYFLVKEIDQIEGFSGRLFHTQFESARLAGHYQHAIQLIDKLRPYIKFTEQQDFNNKIWQTLIHLPWPESQQMARISGSELDGWLTLLALSYEQLHQPTELLQKVLQWQQQSANHPASKHLPQPLITALQDTPIRPQNLAVILPLSGQFAQQGEAVQQGIIAAQFEQGNKQQTVTFLDSETLDYNQLATANYDFYIGPLLKSNITRLIEQQPNQPMLLLNEAKQEDLPNHPQRFYYALAPEAEARQAALKMLKNGLQQPIVLASNDNYGRRMSEAFRQVYADQGSPVVGYGYFSNPEEMEDTVERLMETGTSKSRIRTVKQLLNNSPKFEADARNRQDIDSIYIIGNETETRIIKPYIDVNTSPFAPLVPIYASSRSFSSRLNNADMRDLNRIIFSDMPWLLPGRAKHTKLANQMQLVWQNASDDKSRFFAFGFDAYQLTQHLLKMKHLPNYAYDGLSGRLTLAGNKVERSLSWAKFSRSRIVAVNP